MKKNLLTSFVFTLAAITFADLSALAQDTEDHTRSTSKMIIVDEDGEKKMTVTEVVNGQETVTELEGDEVDAYLKKNGHAASKGPNMVFISENDEDVKIDIDMKEILKNLDIHLKQLDSDLDHIIIESHGDSINEDSAKVIIQAFGGEMKELEEAFKDFEFDFSFSSEDNKIIIQKLGDAIDSKEEQIIIELDQVHEKVENIEELLDQLDVDVTVAEDHLNNTKSKKVIVKKTIIISDEAADDESTEPKKVKKLKMKGLKFYPNPTQGEFEIEFDNLSRGTTELSITNIEGQQVYMQSFEGKGKVKEAIDLTKQPKGVYLINIKQGKKLKSMKLVIE